MTSRVVEVSKFNGKSWEPSGTAVFHGFFSDYEEFEAGPGNYPAALIEWEDGKIESVGAHSVRFLVSTLGLERTKESLQSSWLSKEMQAPAKGFPALRTIEPGVYVVVRANGDPRLALWDGRFGVVVEKFNTAGLWSVNIGEDGKTLVAPSCHLEVRG